MIKYPDDWEEVELGDILKYTQPSNYQVESITSKGNIPVLTAGKSFKLGYSMDSSIAYRNLPTILFDDFTTDARYIDFPFSVKSSATKFLNLKSDKFNLRFVFYILDDFDYQIEAHERHWIGIFSKLKFFIPEIREQKAIADTLTTFDNHIENLEKLIEKKKMIRDGAVEDLMTGKTRLDGFNGEWKEVSIGNELSQIITGGTPSTTVESYWDGDIPWLSSTEIHQKNIKMPTKFITLKGLKESSAKIAPKFSVLIALAGQGKTRGTAGYLSKDMAINQSLAALVVDTSLNSKFLFYCMEYRYDYLRELSSGDGGRGGLNKKLIKNIKIIIPTDIQEQKAIASILTAMDEEIEDLEKEKAKIEKIKAGAMDDLLTGRVRLI